MGEFIEKLIGSTGEVALAGYRASLPIKRLLQDRNEDLSHVWSERLGQGIWRDSFKQVESPLWIHAASVGEVRGILPLIRELSKRVDVPIVGTTTSATGREEFKKVIPSVAILPFDAPSLVTNVLKNTRPRLLLFNETELWPNLLFTARDLDIPCVLVNGRISDRSYPRYQLIRWLSARMLDCFSKILVQTERDAQRFISLGASQATVKMCGSTKFDIPNSQLDARQRAEENATLGLRGDAPCFIAGSVREGEYQQVIAAYCQARQSLPELQLIIAPRHPEYFAEVGKALESQRVSFNRISSCDTTTEMRPALLVDTLGELNRLYPIADTAFVGGTLVPVGGHNPLEPAAAGLPIFFGPHTENVRDLAEELLAQGAAKRVYSSEELASALVSLLRDTTLYKGASEAALAVCQRHRGAVARIVEELLEFL